MFKPPEGAGEGRDPHSGLLSVRLGSWSPGSVEVTREGLRGHRDVSLSAVVSESPDPLWGLEEVREPALPSLRAITVYPSIGIFCIPANLSKPLLLDSGL